MSELGVWSSRSEIASNGVLDANSDFREFERVRRLMNSCLRLQILPIFIENRFWRLRGLGLQNHMLWLGWIVHEANLKNMVPM